ncbi:polysaccharide pyruvyl transferase family protein [Oceanibium sediminis]|uniref:polysaccharide pyruvyl transferase family protein n=1 Tax=Oceanibium sediminis TaxID=2026339 RepID=UPI000DD4887C|nr:polysaccharide pyruvyl transferase family protein [Oceanibium sediminis]
MGDPFCTDKSAEIQPPHLVPGTARAARAGLTDTARHPRLAAIGPASRVAVFNVKYSENLGDGLIAEAMEAGLAEAGLHVTPLDLAGRDDFGAPTLRNRSLALAVLRSMPPPLRRKVVEFKLQPRINTLIPTWREAISAAEHVVIGGGQLFQDGDLNFPLKVGAVLDIARQERTPVSIHAVGVSADWSARGRALFGRLLECRIGQVTVRDAASRQNWAAHFRGTALERADLAPDPVIGFQTPPAPRADRVLLGVTHPRVLSYHGSHGAAAPQLTLELARLLTARGHAVTLFSNGAREDEDQIDALFQNPAAHAPIAEGLLSRAPRPVRPADLVENLRPASVVIAHRLHANILAYAMGKPCVGLAWDPKLEGFFKLTARPEFLFNPDTHPASEIARTAEYAARSGLDPRHRERLIASAQDALLTLARSIKDHKPTQAHPLQEATP